MDYTGIDLHKKTVSLCAVNQASDVQGHKRLPCDDPERIVAGVHSP